MLESSARLGSIQAMVELSDQQHVADKSDPIGIKGGLNRFVCSAANSLLNSDPTGLNPAAAIGASYGATLGSAGAVIGAALGFGAAWVGGTLPGRFLTEARGWFTNVDANREWEAYKERFDAPNPSGMDPCEEARWRLKPDQELLDARRTWDAKWVPRGTPNHSQAIGQSINAVKNAQQRVERECNCP